MKRNSGFSLVELLIVIAIVVIIGAIVVSSFGSSSSYETQATEALRAQGLQPVKVESVHRWNARYYGCAKSDGVAVEVISTNPNCDLVHHVVCMGGVGSYKSATVRDGKVLQQSYPGCRR